MVSAAASSAASAQLFRQAEGLKANISGKYSETTDHFSEEYTKRKNLQDIYKTILLSDLQYALDRKVELELWNNAFKGHIDYLRQRVKEKRGSDKAELQAKLWFFIDASIGFYLQLLQEFCDCNELSLPFRTKSINLGILPEYEIDRKEKPKASSCYYICQDCLVHLGDLAILVGQMQAEAVGFKHLAPEQQNARSSLYFEIIGSDNKFPNAVNYSSFICTELKHARYRNDVTQAEAYYKLASNIVAVNGQPYNQLAIIASARGDNLRAIFYYCKSVLVQNPFPAAVSNLQKTFNQFCSRQSVSLLAKNECSSPEEYINLFLQYHGSVYLMHNIVKLPTLQQKILADFKEISEELTADQLLHLTVLNIFTLYKNKPREDYEQEDCISEDEIEVWNLVIIFSVSFYASLVTLALRQYESANEAEDDEKYLPSIKIFSDWLLCTGASILLENVLESNIGFYREFSLLGNEILKRSGPLTSPSATPLPEDNEVRGFFPLRRIHRKLNFKSTENVKDKVASLRAYRIISFLNWLCQQDPASRHIGKGESGGEARFVCLQAEVPRDERFAPEDCRMSDKDFDIALTKLFDTLPELEMKKERTVRSKSPFRETRSLFRTDSEEQGIKEIPQVSGPVASYSLFESKWSVPFKRSPSKESPSDDQGYPEIFEKLAVSATKGTITATQTTKESVTTQPDVFPKATKSPNIGVFPSSASASRPQPKPPQLMREPYPQPQPLSPMNSQMPTHPVQQQLTRGPHNPPLQPPSNFYKNQHAVMMAQNRMQMPHMDLPIALNGTNPPVRNPPGPPLNINQQALPLFNQTQSVQYAVQPTIPPQPSAFTGFVPTVVSNGAVFGAIGQTPRSQHQNPGQMNMTPPGSPGMTRNAAKSNQSIWSSNYGFGQGALSPLEQLLKDQKQTQGYQMPPK